jgi:NADH-quinone oxidoreductase subunit M
LIWPHAGLPVSFQMWCFPLVFTGFAILAGMWPFHTWAPTGHVAAPTAASMLLAGVVMKLGAYGCLRVGIWLFPHGLDPWGFSLLGVGSWRDVFAVLAVIGIVYGALVALAQTDFKFVIGYSSVSHMGFVLLGLMTLNQIGVTGAVLQMFSHGIIAGLLFAIVGRIVYDRTHTRQLAELETMHLSRRLPFAAWAFVIAGMASMGLPGFSGFVAELQVLVGAWMAKPWWTIAQRAWALWWAWRIRGARCRRRSSATCCRPRMSWSRSMAHRLRRLPGRRLRAWRCWRGVSLAVGFIREFCWMRLNRR